MATYDPTTGRVLDEPTTLTDVGMGCLLWAGVIVVALVVVHLLGWTGQIFAG